MQKVVTPEGFTLFEALIVLAIIGLLMSAAVPSFSGLITVRRVEVSTHRLENVLVRALNEARARHENIVISWGSDMQQALTVRSADRVIHVEEEGESRVRISSNLSGANRIEIDYNGLPELGRDIQFVVCGSLSGGRVESRNIMLSKGGEVFVRDSGGGAAC